MERHQLIERSLITTYRSKIWAKFIKALKEYKLLLPGDKVCVCISGGKDSMVMAKLFQELKKHSDFDFEVEYLVMNPGYNDLNLEVIKRNLDILKVPAKIVETDIFEIASIQTKSPCYLCAKMRRGALYKIAQDLGCNKIALGHHFDDVVETILLSMIYGGEYKSMMPKLKSTNFEGMELIRPLYLVREEDILAWKKYNNLEFINCACKFTEKDNLKDSKRLEIKMLIKELEKKNKNIAYNIFASSENVNVDTVLATKKDGVKTTFLDNYDK